MLFISCNFPSFSFLVIIDRELKKIKFPLWNYVLKVFQFLNETRKIIYSYRAFYHPKFLFLPLLIFLFPFLFLFFSLYLSSVNWERSNWNYEIMFKSSLNPWTTLERLWLVLCFSSSEISLSFIVFNYRLRIKGY